MADRGNAKCKLFPCWSHLQSRPPDSASGTRKTLKSEYGNRAKRQEEALSSKHRLFAPEWLTGSPEVREEVLRGNGKGSRQFDNVLESDVSLAAFNAANVVPMQARPFG